MSDDQPRAWVDLGLEICDATDPVALGGFRRDLQISAKPDRTLVTEVDTAVERLIRERLQRAHPEHGLVGEEFGTEAGHAPVRWYIDPIDGTHNFVRGVPIFATLLAVERDGVLEAAVISAPALGERWFAWRGGGAWAVGRGGKSGDARRLAVSRVATVGDAQVFYGSGRDLVASGTMPGFEALLDSAWRERGFGDFWGYALLAEGAAEAMTEVGLKAWDAAAPALLVEEAGGRWSDIDGGRGLDGGTFVATNGILHDEVLRRLREPVARTIGGAPTP